MRERTHHERRWPRRLLIALAIVGALLIVARVVLDPIAAHYTRQALSRSPTMRGAIAGVHVGLLPPSYEVRRLKIIEKPDGRWDEPLYYIERALVTVHWRELLRGHFVGRVRLEEPKIVIAREHEEKSKEAPSVLDRLEEALPLRLDRVDVVNGELLIAQKGKGGPQLWVHNLDLVASNLATRKALMEGERSTLKVKARVQQSGRLSINMDMDPYAKGLTFKGRASLEGLPAKELHAFLQENADLRASSGTVDVYAELRARDGWVTGGVKPILKNLEIESADKGLGNRLKAALADAAVELASDDVPGRDAVATVIPIKGRVKDMDAQLVPAVLGVVRNAFVVALASGFQGVPPRTAEKKEGIFEQLKESFQREEGPPEAQPKPGEPRPPAQGRTPERRR